MSLSSLELGPVVRQLRKRQQDSGQKPPQELRMRQQDSGQKPVAADMGKLVVDLKTALAQSDERRRQAQEQLEAFAADAAAAEASLLERLQHSREHLRALKAERRRAVRDLQESRLLEELREAEAQRDESIRATRELEVELAQACPWALDGSPAGQSVGAIALVGMGTLGADGMQSVLRGEVRALRVALAAAEAQREEALQIRAASREEEAMQQLEEAQLADLRELEAAEDRLRVARACVAKSLSMQPAHDNSQAALQSARSRVQAREAACEELEATLAPIREECGQLLLLRSAAEARAAQLEQRLQVSLRFNAERALRTLRQTDYRGSAALVFVLARLCGTPRLAFLVLDSNRSGNIAMVEFDSGLRLRFGLDYETITGMKLRALFKEFDITRRGVVRFEDFASRHADIWVKCGRTDASSVHGTPHEQSSMSTLKGFVEDELVT